MSTPEGQKAAASPQLSEVVTQSEKSLGATTEMSAAGETPRMAKVFNSRHYTSSIRLLSVYSEGCNLERELTALRSKVSSLEQENERLKGEVSKVTKSAIIWQDGVPALPYKKEWFLARTRNGDIAALRSLPEDWSYKFTTADETHCMEDFIVKWAQLPTSEFRTPLEEAEKLLAESRSQSAALLAQVEELKKDKERLDWFEKCGSFFKWSQPERRFKTWGIVGPDESTTIRQAIDTARSSLAQQKQT